MRPLAAALVLWGAGLLAAAPAAGQVVSAAPDATAVTIYRTEVWGPEHDLRLDRLRPYEGLAMIRETRMVDLPAGVSRVAFRGVADTMVAQTAAVEGLPGAMLERNQDYNLLTPGALIEASVGAPVKLVRTHPETGAVTVRPGVLRSGAAGPILEVDGGFEAVGCSRAPERLVFDALPAGLADKPTFSVLTDAPRAGRYKVTLSYLATGLAWSADYVAKIAPDGRTLDLLGWVTLSNQTSASFAGAPTDVVAGDLSRDDDTKPRETQPVRLRRDCWQSRLPPLPVPPVMQAGYLQDAPSADVQEVVLTAQKRVEQSDLGDYKLYTLVEPTTVASRQTKQVRFLHLRGVPFERLYGFRFDAGDYETEKIERAANILLRLRNEAKRGLGQPLPSGLYTVTARDPSGAPVVVGQRRGRDTPVGLPLELELGRAMDVRVAVVTTEDQAVAEGERYDLTVTISNGKPVPITFEYRQAAMGEGFRVSRASRRPGASNGDPTWTLRLGPGETAQLSYRVDYKY